MVWYDIIREVCSSYLTSLQEHKSDRAAFDACDTINAAAKALGPRSLCLVESDFNNPSQKPGAADWHMTALAHWGRNIYLFDPSFDPNGNNAVNGRNLLRLENRHGCSNLSRINKYVRTAKNLQCSAIKNRCNKSVKGLGYHIDEIWMTGFGSREMDCMYNTCTWVNACLAGVAGLPGMKNNHNLIYRQVESRWCENSEMIALAWGGVLQS